MKPLLALLIASAAFGQITCSTATSAALCPVTSRRHHHADGYQQRHMVIGGQSLVSQHWTHEVELCNT